MIGTYIALINPSQQYVTHSRKMGPFLQNSDCKLELSADSANSVVHAHENHLVLAHLFPKLQSFELLTLVLRYPHLFQSCSKVPGVSVYYWK